MYGYTSGGYGYGGGIIAFFLVIFIVLCLFGVGGYGYGGSGSRCGSCR